jgi:hypothetical protein
MLFQLDNIETVWFKLRKPPVYFIYLQYYAQITTFAPPNW